MRLRGWCLVVFSAACGEHIDVAEEVEPSSPGCCTSPTDGGDAPFDAGQGLDAGGSGDAGAGLGDGGSGDAGPELDGGADDGGGPSSLDGGASRDGGGDAGRDAGSDAGCGAGAPVLIGLHPYAALQTTAPGRFLYDTEGFHGRVYFGFGDYTANTGPIRLIGYEPWTGQFDGGSLNFATEAVDRFRRIGDRIYALATDPLSTEDEGYAVRDAGGAWRQKQLAPAQRPVHAFDIAERFPGELYLTGSSNSRNTTIDAGEDGGSLGGATVWRSTDNGQSWQVDLAINETNSNFSRFYSVGTLGGRVFVSESDSRASWVRDDGGWSRGPLLTGFNGFGTSGQGKPVAFAGKLLWQSYSGLRSFDGATVTILRPSATAHEVAEGHLVVVEAGKVWSTPDLVSWTCHGTAPAGQLSMGITDGGLYFGKAEAEMYRFDQPLW